VKGEHISIIDALLRGDAQRACDLIDAHVYETLTWWGISLTVAAPAGRVSTRRRAHGTTE
jgi:DNA-binding FadR family transcriptional regulator